MEYQCSPSELSFSLTPFFSFAHLTEGFGFCSPFISLFPLAATDFVLFHSKGTPLIPPRGECSLMAFSQGRTHEAPFSTLSRFLLWLPCRPRGLIIYKQKRSPDINKNNLMFHIRLLREEEALVLLGGSALLWVMSQNKQIKRLSSRLFSYHSILVAFFHVGEQWLKWLYWSSLMGSQMKPARAVEINWFILKLGLL